MKKFSKDKLIIVAIIIGGLITILGIIVFMRSFSANEQEDLSEIEKIEISTSKGGLLTVHRNGAVEYERDGIFYSDFWDPNKTSAFFSYFGKFFLGDYFGSGSNSITIYTQNGSESSSYEDDELVDAVEDETAGDDEEDPGDIGGYYGTPTPAPSGSSGGSDDDECIYWILSYCVIMRTSTPTPTAAPAGESTALPPSCNVNENQQTGRTIISNELCIPSPLPQ